ncbi:MAG: flagellar brake protein [Chloroflexota bacterium]
MIVIPSEIRLGMTVLIGVQAETGATNQYKSRLESIEDEALAVAMPSEGGRPVLIAAGEKVTLMVSTRDAAQLISGEVTGRRAQPLPMLLIKPTKVESSQRRLLHRVPVTLDGLTVHWWLGEDAPREIHRPPAEASADPRPSRFSFNRGGGAGSAGEADAGSAAEGQGAQPATNWKLLRATAVDISGNGIGLVVGEEVPEGARLYVKVPLPAGDGTFETRGRVVITRPVTRGGRQCHRLGVKFEGLPNREQERLVKALHQYQIELRRRSLAYDR